MRQGFPVSHAAKAHFRSFSQKAIERNVLRHALFTCDLPSRRTMSSHVVSKTARGRTTSSSWLRSTSTSSNAPLLHAAWSTNGRTGFARSTSSTRSFGSSTDKNYSLANEELLSLSSSIGASATPDTRVPTQHEATASSIVDQRAGGGLEQGLDHLLVAPDRIDATTTGSALTSEVAVQMETSSSHFSSIGEFFYMPVHGVHECLQFLHDTAGCNWVAVAVLVPWVLKAVVQLPAQLQIQKQMQRDAPKLIELQLAASELSQKFLLDSQRFVKEYQALCRKNNINPFVAQFRPFLGALALMPCHLSIFVAFRNMERFSPGWNVEGFFWFQDLNAPDCYTALPLATTCLTMAAIKISASYISDPQHQRIMHMLSFVFGCGTLPLMAYLGSGFNLYCCSNILSTVAMSALLRNTQFRALFGLKPNTKVDENGNVVLVNPLAAAKVKAVGDSVAADGNARKLSTSTASAAEVMEMKKENVNSRASLGATSNSTTSKLPLEVAVNSTTRSSSATSSNLEVAASGSSSIGSATCRNSASRGSSASSSELSVVSSSRGVIARGPHDFDGDHQLSICNSLSLHGAQEVAQFKPASTAVMRETKRLNQEFFEGKARIGIFRSSNHPFRRFLYFTLGIVLLANAGRRQWEMHKDIEEMGHERAAQKWCPRTIKAAADQQRAVMQKAQIIDDDGDEEDEDGPF